MIEHRSLPRLSFALFCAWLSSDFVGLLVRCSGSSRWGVGDAIATAVLASGPAIVLAVAALASARSEAGLALAGGLVVGAAPFVPIVVVTTVVAIALGRRWERARDRVPLAGLGMLIGLCLCGLTTDLAASVAPSVSHPMHWWASDPVGQRVPRAALELANARRRDRVRARPCDSRRAVRP